MKKVTPETVNNSSTFNPNTELISYYDFSNLSIIHKDDYIKRNGFVVLSKRMIRQLTEDILAYAKLKLDKPLYQILII